MAKQNLKFYRGVSAPSNAIIGSIFFDTNTREIKVKTGDSTWESYAGKITDAEWKNQHLTITRNDGTNIDLDFSDVASASTLSTLSTNFNNLKSAFETEQGYIDTLQTTVGDSQSGLVKSVADHTEALAKLHGTKDEEGSIANQIASEATLRKNADDALGLRIDGVAAVNDTQNGRLDALETFKNGQETAVNNAIDAKINALAGEKTGDGALIDVTVKTKGGEVDSVSIDETALTTRLSGIDTSISTGIAGINEKLGGSYDKKNTVASAIADVAAEVKTERERMDAFMKLNDGETLDQALDSLKELQDYIKTEADAADQLVTKVGENTTAINGLKDQVGTGTVDSRIATAKGEAISAAAEDAATKANTAKTEAIAAAKTETTNQVTALGKSVTANDTAIKALDAAIKALDVTDTAVDGEYVSAVSQTDGQIAVSRLALPSATVGESTVASGKHVAVEVVEVKGKITAVNVNESDIASASALTQLTTKVGNIESALETILVWEEF